MSQTFSAATIDRLAKQLREPAWLTQLRHKAWAAHTSLPWPHASDDVWRRTDVSLLDPLRGFEPTQPSLLSRLPLTEAELAQFTRPLGNEQLAVRANGAWLVPPGGQEVVIQDLTETAHRHPDTIRSAIEADGLSLAEQKLTSLNAAFHHDDLFVQVPDGFTGAAPFRLVHVVSTSAQQALFPMTLIRVGSGSTVTLIDEYASLEPAGSAETPHLVNARIELLVEPGATVRYVRLQRWGAGAREFLLLRATLAKGSTLTMANVNLGAAVSKAHIITKLAGEQASTKLCGFVFGHGRQHVDQHTLQDHQAPHTESDLQFRAALQDESR
ncbi:MAG: SufD family Fe-S cluster assembly protein, partial [Candidatus Omnitrophica bacterium]|nr:SufD family Fe-S cluster assembly protein [Candidatus Omnitrophota bacterium]